MFISFEKLPGDARVWIYQADRILDSQTVEDIENETHLFLENWTSHKADVLASCKMVYGLFLIIGADEAFNSTGGCSIDVKIRFIRTLEGKYGISFFDRHRIAFIDQDAISIRTFNEYSSMLNEGRVNDRTIVFNNLVSTVRELSENWQVPFIHAWQRNLLIV
jgi:hypothetical protein